MSHELDEIEAAATAAKAEPCHVTRVLEAKTHFDVRKGKGGAMIEVHVCISL